MTTTKCQFNMVLDKITCCPVFGTYSFVPNMFRNEGHIIDPIMDPLQRNTQHYNMVITTYSWNCMLHMNMPFEL